jgi:hypothetical protein
MSEKFISLPLIATCHKQDGNILARIFFLNMCEGAFCLLFLFAGTSVLELLAVY